MANDPAIPPLYSIGGQNMKELLGKSVWVELKQGGIFLFKITGCGNEYITGYDTEGENLVISISDIEQVYKS
jgi:hypothetical protein